MRVCRVDGGAERRGDGDARNPFGALDDEGRRNEKDCLYAGVSRGEYRRRCAKDACVAKRIVYRGDVGRGAARNAFPAELSAGENVSVKDLHGRGRYALTENSAGFYLYEKAKIASFAENRLFRPAVFFCLAALSVVLFVVCVVGCANRLKGRNVPRTNNKNF